MGTEATEIHRTWQQSHYTGVRYEPVITPFKYKTAEQPMTTSSNKLIVLDTSVFFATGNPSQAISAGLITGSPAEPYSWVTTDEFLMLNHEIMPAERALTCNQCHGTTNQMDLAYLKGPQSSVYSVPDDRAT